MGTAVKFESSGLQRNHGEASWEWAQGFELSIICVAVIQVATLSALLPTCIAARS